MAEVLEQVAREVASCTRCPLHKGRCKTVPGEGSSNARLMFIGEAPGYHEDQQGRPFVGPSGDLLNKLINAIKFKREDVFIANVVKCRPPENRDPSPEEIAACKPFLDRQIAAINPRVIVTLGRFSMARWFPGERISQSHGKTKVESGRLIMPMFHPAAALRDRTRTMLLFKEDGLTIPSLLERAEEIAATELWGMLDSQPAEPEAPLASSLNRVTERPPTNYPSTEAEVVGQSSEAGQIAEAPVVYQPQEKRVTEHSLSEAEVVAQSLNRAMERPPTNYPSTEAEVVGQPSEAGQMITELSPVAVQEVVAQPSEVGQVVAGRKRKPKAINAANVADANPPVADSETQDASMLELLEVESNAPSENAKAGNSGRKKKKESAIAAEQLTLF